MTRKARLQTLAADLRSAAAPTEPPAAAPIVPPPPPRSPNPARGLRGDFHKITITLPMDMLRDLRLLGLARRADGAKSTGVSELVREAIDDLLERAHATEPPRRPRPCHYSRQRTLSGVGWQAGVPHA